MANYVEFEEKMKKTLAALGNDYAGLRAGRANPAVLDRLRVEYYGASSKINEVAAVSVPEPRMLM
ncbi:MAG: ribosome recycling factor, partial [Clostridia bacterium]|nr:ribosome recycling factor [Clostridia bacterium]